MKFIAPHDATKMAARSLPEREEGEVMTSDVNHFRCTGTIVSNAEIKELPNQKHVANFKLKLTESVATRNGTKTFSQILKVVAWNDLARHANKHAKVGVRISLHGRIQRAEWEGKEGEHHYAYEVQLTEPIKTLEEWIEQLPALTPRYGS